MKLSRLKEIVKEELVKELGFDYPGKQPSSPSEYQKGIMDTLQAMQQLGHKIDINAVMDILYPENLVHEAPQPQIAEPDVDVDTEKDTKRRRTITPVEPIEEPAKAKKIADKIAARFKNK